MNRKVERPTWSPFTDEEDPDVEQKWDNDVSRGYTSKPMYDPDPWYDDGDNSETAKNHRNRTYRNKVHENTR